MLSSKAALTATMISVAFRGTFEISSNAVSCDHVMLLRLCVTSTSDWLSTCVHVAMIDINRQVTYECTCDCMHWHKHTCTHECI